MISSILQKAINRQINRELTSAYNYMAMSAWFATTPYSGFVEWMQLQSREEMSHAMKFHDYLNDRNGKVIFELLKKPKGNFKGPLDVFEKALAQEQDISQNIRELYFLAEEKKDPETKSFLNWFLDEQIEEEKSVGEIVDKLRLIGDNVNALLNLDARIVEKRDA